MLNKTLPGKYVISFWSTTVFPRVLGDLESSVFPFGAFIGIAIELRDTK